MVFMGGAVLSVDIMRNKPEFWVSKAGTRNTRGGIDAYKSAAPRERARGPCDVNATTVSSSWASRIGFDRASSLSLFIGRRTTRSAPVRGRRRGRRSVAFAFAAVAFASVSAWRFRHPCIFSLRIPALSARSAALSPPSSTMYPARSYRAMAATLFSRRGRLRRTRRLGRRRFIVEQAGRAPCVR